MPLTDGTHRIGPESGTFLLRTGRAGVGAKAGHDLTIAATRWSGEVEVDTSDPSQSAARVEVEVDSLEVREGKGGIKPLTDSDKAEIKQTLREKILRPDRHPKITFEATGVSGSAGAHAARAARASDGSAASVATRRGSG
jgi:polyisoprenoid-binding protein YceI